MKDFVAFPKIPRFSENVVITEKIDGTNAQVLLVPAESEGVSNFLIATVDGLNIYAGSRNRYLTPEDDNFGFAKWVKFNSSELAKLGEGQHFGEWWGQGIQRRYGLEEKRFSLFNTARWAPGRDTVPSVCHVVPTLYHGPVSGVADTLASLKDTGSLAAPGFMNPEGIVIYNMLSRTSSKLTFENVSGKWAMQEAA